MRSRHALRALPLLPLLSLGCFSSSTPTPVVDASTDATADDAGPEASAQDAPLNPETSPADAPSADAPSTDAAAADATVPADAGAGADAGSEAAADGGVARLAVVVGAPTGLESAAPVVWSDATGAVVDTSTTDAQGRATTSAPTAVTVTVVLGTPLAPMLYTVMGLTTGETLPVVDVTQLVAHSSATVHVYIPAYPPQGSIEAAAPEFSDFVGDTFGGGAAPVTLPVYVNNGVGVIQTDAGYVASIPTIAEIYPSGGTPPLGYAWTSAPLPPYDAGTDAGTETVALSSAWSTNYHQEQTALSGWDGGGVMTTTFSEVIDGLLMGMDNYNLAPGNPAPGEVQYSYTHPDLEQGYQIETTFTTGMPADGNYAVTFIGAGPPLTADTVITFDTTALGSAPYIASTGVVASAAGQPVFSWTLGSGDLSAATAIVFTGAWVATVGGQSQSGQWTIVSPGTSAASLTPPKLPAALAQYANPSGANGGYGALYAVQGGTEFPDYASFIPGASVFLRMVCGAGSPTYPVLAGTGTSVITSKSTSYVTCPP